MPGLADFLTQVPLDSEVVRIALAGALGLFLGLEREWSHKPAGIRTFTLISLLGAVFTLLDKDVLLFLGGLLVIVQGIMLGVQGLMADTEEEEGLSLTTSVSMLVSFGVGALVMQGYILVGVTVAVLSSLLLVLKRELHSFAWGMSREELRSAVEFAILAFVIYPLLPGEEFAFGIQPRVVWLMVVTVAAIGIVNYAVVTAYGGRGIAVTGFFGGLASSTAVVGTMLDHVRQRPEAASYGVAAILLADAAMAVRNLAIALAFTFPSGRPVLYGAILPLGAVILGSVAIAAYTADWSEKVEMNLESPFSLRNALGFGAIFLLVIAGGAVAQQQFGSAGFYVTAVLSGLVSSAGATSSAVLLYMGGTIDHQTSVFGILLATASSIVVKAALTISAPDRSFSYRVAAWSGVLLAGSAIAAVLATL
ncbi:MgtC/SapB family protein [Halorussus gelatinilyticus]|uniref:MgtC/SapB family protein n=1 Tax=Halorussus gelatinilyticus TaxID=2937524 RepID=A0A8U0IHN4_9EURY|nr:MgtC/SapB family protein [Halorussus gelatinilyticus]UPW00597.1 MgtC/SapB family protein [Halorussus gelatinilyticus]